MFSIGWWFVVRMSATPPETCLLRYVQFWVGSDGERPYISLVLVQFLPLICGRLLADLDSSHVFIVIIYSDTRK